MGIYDIGQRLKFKALKEMAAQMVKAIAKERGLREEELADRLVPTLGLSESGTLRLDFGPRAFHVLFDESLKTQLRDEDGKVLKSLPKPNKSDDADKAKEAKAALSALKKDVKAIAGAQVTRMEKSMTRGRRWSVENFERFFAQHPLMRHLAQRLVWATFEGDETKTTFRPTDEGYADAADEPFSPHTEDEIGIPHPLDLDEAALASWGQVFADYELTQPFPQLSRTGYDTKAVLALVKELTGKSCPTGDVLALGKRGWTRGQPQDSGHVAEMNRRCAETTVRLELDPGFNVSEVSEFPVQTLSGVFIDNKPLRKPNLSALPRLEQSELAWSLGPLS